MENEKEKRSNLCAQIGFLLTLLNLVVSFAFLLTGSTLWLLLFTSVTAVLSLILCGIGKRNAKRIGKGKTLSIIGIVVNVLILIAIALFAGWLILIIESCRSILTK